MKAVATDVVGWAEQRARRLLEPLGARWVHTRAVADRAAQLARCGLPEGDVLVAAAYVHDLGHAPQLHDTGHHGIDGARYLQRNGQPRLANLVAHHSGAVVEARLRGLERELSAFAVEDSLVADALAYCDVTTDLHGCPVTLEERIADIGARYGPHHLVTQAVELARPQLADAVARTEALLAAPVTR